MAAIPGLVIAARAPTAAPVKVQHFQATRQRGCASVSFWKPSPAGNQSCYPAVTRTAQLEGFSSMATSVRILDIEPVTHNVRRYKFEKPAGFTFEPGQATDVSIDGPGWRDVKNPFTFTSLAEWDHLEFTIKSYFDRDAVTKHLYELVPGDRLLIREAWGTIAYKG